MSACAGYGRDSSQRVAELLMRHDGPTMEALAELMSLLESSAHGRYFNLGHQ